MNYKNLKLFETFLITNVKHVYEVIIFAQSNIISIYDTTIIVSYLIYTELGNEDGGCGMGMMI